MVRKAVRQDTDSIYALICELEGRSLPKEIFSEIYLEMLGSPLYGCFVAEREGEIIGCLNLRMENQLHHGGKVAEIMELAVKSACRSQGIGGELFNRASLFARERGCVQMEVCCNQIRTRAHSFYKRCGMQSTHDKLTMDMGGQKRI